MLSHSTFNSTLCFANIFFGLYLRPSCDVLNKAFHLCKDYLTGSWARMTIDDFELTPLG